MSGRWFVLALAALAALAVVTIAGGVPEWGRPDAGADAGIGATPDAAKAPEAAKAPGADEARTPGVHGPAAEDRRDRRARASDGVAMADRAIDHRVTSSADTAARWPYRRTAVADLDADAVPERLVVASDVHVNADGEPTWGDEQRWAVFVEEDDGVRTLIYSAVAPPGGVSAAVGEPTEAGLRPIVVIERGGRSARLLLGSYAGTGRTSLVDVAGAGVEQWVDRVSEETRWID